MHFTLKRLSITDLPSVQGWLLQPHVAQWFGDPSEWLEESSRSWTPSGCGTFVQIWQGFPPGLPNATTRPKRPREPGVHSRRAPWAWIIS
jgi:hypothetical protein